MKTVLMVKFFAWRKRPPCLPDSSPVQQVRWRGVDDGQQSWLGIKARFCSPLRVRWDDYRNMNGFVHGLLGCRKLHDFILGRVLANDFGQYQSRSEKEKQNGEDFPQAKAANCYHEVKIGSRCDDKFIDSKISF
ncbi:hypothetical protein CEXT_475981 [Caerostris extrusa]|uniref:Uncharacterized protein n=1 Tax=Caerostris extrusa TaxID=172846 RepID=A0AAV4SW60_CAEEX|nr:hypothetical protein CEXT_475981 [Caerostris extrusa]